MKSIVLTSNTKKKLIGMTFVLPCTIVLLLMISFPVWQTLRFSFSNIKLPFLDLSFAYFDNYIKAFSKPEIWVIVKNTIVWMVFSVLFRLLLGLGSALTMNVNVKGIALLRIIALLPWAIPSVVAANAWRWIFQSDYGVINGTLRTLGLNMFAMNWLGSPKTALSSVIVASTWMGYPFAMMLFLAALQGLPKELYEAAEIDGANRFNLFRYITLPGIKAVLFIVLALDLISAINAFDLIFVMTGGGPAGASETLGLFIYRLAFTNFDFGTASAVSVLLVLIVLLGFYLYSIAKRGGNGEY